MEPNIWGRGAWTFLHSITMNYPDNPTKQQKKTYMDFFNQVGNVLPCNICKNNYKIHLNKNPINFNLSSKKKLVKWLFDVHNDANLVTGKDKIGFDEFINHYKYLYEKPTHSLYYYKSQNYNLKKYIAILIVLLIIVASILIFQRFNIKLS